MTKRVSPLAPMTVLRERRLALQMSQEQLSKLCGVSQVYISNIELRKPSYQEDRVKIALFLDLDSNKLSDLVQAEGVS